VVTRHRDTHGLNATLAAVELPKSTWYYWQKHKVDMTEKYQHLKTPLQTIVERHPGYGYRRLTPELQQQGYQVGKEVVRQLTKQWHLALGRPVTTPKPSVARAFLQHRAGTLNLVERLDPDAILPFAVWYTDFTEILYRHGEKKASCMPILDHHSKWIPGWGVGDRANTAVALDAFTRLEMVN